jgi:hypothetical protein
MVIAPRRITASGDMTDMIFEGDVDFEVERLISKPSALQAELGATPGSKRAGLYHRIIEYLHIFKAKVSSLWRLRFREPRLLEVRDTLGC